MERSVSTGSSPVKNIALGMLGMFIGALIFILGMTAGVVMSRPGGLLFIGASPFTSLSPSVAVSAGESDATAEQQGLNYALINDVIHRLRTQWYGEMPSSAQLTDGAIKGLVNALGDEFTQYVEPRFAKLLNEDITGAFDGIGATLKQTPSGSIQIVRTFPGMPADRGGVLPGDIIEAVNGVSTQGLNSTEVAAMVRGPRGTEVTLTLRRADRPRPFQVTLIRERIEIPLVSSRMVGDGSIGYISLFDFSQPASKQLEKHLKEILEKQPKALIFDLRDNPGGLLSQAQEVGDIFLKKGVFVIERDYRGNKKVTSTTDRGIAQDIPMVVLVNGGSASAAEIVAGAMQDTGRATLIGEKTFGKGSVQSPQTLSNGGQLRITIERWYTPNDRAIHGVGITPDYIVSNSPEDVRDGKDPQLEAAIEFLTSGKTPPPTPIPTVAPTPLP
ncbi:MAG: S41 family peptidase [Anaerolineae bacterium]|nr:S41 family peptidase [Candidatus Roseilinea sp.]MDW8451602.1 S41 family peptidase [Anaerolineae bacterium]